MSKPKILMVGCGNMGGAILHGWQEADLFDTCDIVKPSPLPAEFQTDNITHYTSPPDKAYDVVMFAVKPQVIQKILPDYTSILGKSGFAISVLAGTPAKSFGDIAMVRAMPNTPSSIGQGMTALYANPKVTGAQKELTSKLFQACGDIIWLDQENQINDATAISGSGPAYIFYMIECLTQAAQDLGLNSEQAEKLARQTVIGAAALADDNSDISARTLRENVTSPNGTTAAGLNVLMHDKNGLKDLMCETAQAAAKRARELAE